MKRNIIIAALLIGLIALVVIGLRSSNSNSGDADQASAAPTTDPLDTVSDFYNPWLDAVLSTTTDPYQAGLNVNPVLSSDVQQYIIDNREAEIEPVLCQPQTPERVGAKTLFRTDTQAQVQVLGRGLPEKSPYFALVTLTAVDGEWQVSEIACRSGESGPEREYSFEGSGQLLKQVPPPLDSNNWHLVFTNPEPGVVPLFFSETSECVTGGETQICDPNQFTETASATVVGNMTESGVDVVRVAY